MAYDLNSSWSQHDGWSECHEWHGRYSGTDCEVGRQMEQLHALKSDNTRLTQLVDALESENSNLTGELNERTTQLALARSGKKASRSASTSVAVGSEQVCLEDGEIDWTGVNNVLRYGEYGLDAKELRRLLEVSDANEDDPQAKMVREYYCDCCDVKNNGFLQACEHVVGLRHKSNHKPTPQLQDLAENMSRAWIIIQTMKDQVQ